MQRGRFMMKWIVLSLSLVACQGENDPEGRLRQYLDIRLKGGHDKSEVMGFLTGKMKDELGQMGDAEFEQFRSLKIKNIKGLKVLKKICRSEGVCFLTYTFKYSKAVFDGNPEEAKDVEVEIKKIAKLELIEESWKIAAIDNMKSFVKFNKPIDIHE